MTLTLTLDANVEAGLLARAQEQGMALDEFVQSVVEREALPQAVPSREDAVRRMIEFGEKHRLDLGEPISREVLHEGHRY